MFVCGRARSICPPSSPTEVFDCKFPPAEIFPDALTFCNNVLTNEAVDANDAVVGVNVIDVAADAVVENELEIVLLAQLLVPNNELVMPPFVILMLPDSMFNDPVSVIDPLENNLLIYPFPQRFPLPPNP